MSGNDNLIQLLAPSHPDTRRQMTHEVTERWLVAYAVAVGDSRPELVDLERSGGVVSHPGFANCLEWPLVEHGAPGIMLTPETLSRGLHIQHEVEYYGVLRGPTLLTTSAELLVAEQKSNAVHIVTQFHTCDQAGQRLVSTRLHMLYPNVRLTGGTLASSTESPLQTGDRPLDLIGSFAVDATNAVIYSECARIWNPIHTDIRVAKAAGLKSTVIHGTETLSRATSIILAHNDMDAGDVSSMACRFRAKVEPGAQFDVRSSSLEEGSLSFDVCSSNGQIVAADGHMSFFR